MLLFNTLKIQKIVKLCKYISTKKTALNLCFWTASLFLWGISSIIFGVNTSEIDIFDIFI